MRRFFRGGAYLFLLSAALYLVTGLAANFFAPKILGKSDWMEGDEPTRLGRFYTPVTSFYDEWIDPRPSPFIGPLF